MPAKNEHATHWYGCYGPRGDLFTQDSNKHPAKMAVQLAYRIFEHGQKRGYWKPGDLILDPMAGIGTTGIVGASLGYNVLLLELEYHFLSMAAANICVLRTKMPDAGKISLLQGDARQLEAVLVHADAAGALSSPPYSSEFREQHPGTRGGEIAQESQRGGSFRGYGAAVSSPPYGGEPRQGTDQHSERQEGGEWSGKYQGGCHPDRLKGASHNKMAGAVTSPTYGDSGLQVGCSHAVRKLAAEGKWDEATALFQQFEEEQVRRGMRRSVRSDPAIRAVIQRSLESENAGYSGGARAPEAAVASPVYPDDPSKHKGSEGPGSGSKARLARSPHPGSVPYGSQTAQIGNLPDPKGDIDAVLSSPPYHQDMNRDRKTSASWEKHCAGRGGLPVERNYGTSPAQIENVKNQETYLSAMRQVYAQLHLVLQPGGVVCLVTKNPVKKGQIRRLDQDTILLMEAVGFTFLERQMAMLAEELGVQQRLDGGADRIRCERKSFFKRLFERKYPDLRVDHEDMLWFQKC